MDRSENMAKELDDFPTTREDQASAKVPASQTQQQTPLAVEMEAPISTEDLIIAGGLGARDDIGSLVPLAVDATDFEESLRAAEEYEDEPAAEESPKRPGLGLNVDEVDFDKGPFLPGNAA